MVEAGQDPRASAGPAAGLKDGVGAPETSQVGPLTQMLRD